MILTGDFFTIRELDPADNSVRVIVQLNPEHAIFKGHFPGMPVVPGVCMMQMVHELMEKITGKLLLLARADQMKFLVVIDPRVNETVVADILYKSVEEGSINVSASLSAGAAICFKFKGTFLPRV